MKNLLVQETQDESNLCCVVRVTTSMWADKRGLHAKKSLVFLRRKCSVHNFLEEDARTIGAEEVLPSVLNLYTVEDGVYEVKICNQLRDWETGNVEDYDYRLVRLGAQR